MTRAMDLVRWEPRVEPALVRRLYRQFASGAVDEGLVDRVAYALYARCESIRVATQAYWGRLECAACRNAFPVDPYAWEAVVECPACRWSVRWRDYYDELKDRHLLGKHFWPALREYLAGLPGARTPADKMLLIDRLIHAVHRGTAKPAAVNLLRGRKKEMVAFLNELAYG